MSEWDRRRLLELSSAIQRYIGNSTLLPGESESLEKIYALARLSSKNVDSNTFDVVTVEKGLCEFCISRGMYECEKQWHLFSERCRLIDDAIY